MKDMSSPRRSGAVSAALAAIIIAATLFAGCTGSTGQQTVSVSGSTTVLPVVQRAAEEFMNTHTDADIQVSGGGSSVGVQAVGEGTADIGMASRDLKSAERERYPDLVRYAVAIDGIALIVHPSNGVNSLTLDQVRGIYNGTITGWDAVGGADRSIVVVGRDSASGTREYFHEVVMQKENFVSTQLEKNSNGAVRQTVAQTPGAIGYVGLGYLGEPVRPLSIVVDGTPVEPTVGNVKAGTYPLARELNLFTRGEAAGTAKEFIEFILGPDGQQIVAEEGFVPIDRGAGGQTVPSA